MIDPTKITNYNLSDEGLEEQFLFWVCAAGKNAKAAAAGLHKFLTTIGGYIYGPFKAIREQVSLGELGLNTLPKMEDLLKSCGIGSYTLKAETMRQVAFSGYNLRNCTPQELELIKGIGPKTSRCFILHTRKDARVAGLDTHMLKFLRSKGHLDAPESTPGNEKNYERFEKLVLKYADEAGKTPAEFDLDVWNFYSQGLNK